MEKYNSEKHYHIVLEAAKYAGEIWITPIAIALRNAGVSWPNLQSPDAEASAVDRDILRAWKELGYHPK